MTRAVHPVRLARNNGIISFHPQEFLYARVEKVLSTEAHKEYYRKRKLRPNTHHYEIFINDIFFRAFRTRTEAFDWIKKNKDDRRSKLHHPNKNGLHKGNGSQYRPKPPHLVSSSKIK